MIGRFSPVTIALAALLVAWSLDPGTTCQAVEVDYYPSSPDLFYNYYVPPGGYGGVPAQLYISPRPTPPVVGHTYITYQPLMPHEMLYPHSRLHWRQHGDGGWTRTLVVWNRKCCGLDRLCPPPAAIQPQRTFGFDPLLGNPR